MSSTMVDHAKICQMLDAGWKVRLYKGPMGTYEVRAFHDKPWIMQRSFDACKGQIDGDLMQKLAAMNECSHDDVAAHLLLDDGWFMCDDFTPEQALTRMAYKAVDGVMLDDEDADREGA